MALTEIKQLGLDDEAVNEGKIQISNAGTNGQYLQKQSGNTGGLTWADVPAGVGGATGVDFNDDVKIRLGTGNDLEVYHSGTYNRSYINATGTNHDLTIAADEVAITNSAISETSAKFIVDGAVELYYDNSKKLETTSAGIEISGIPKIKAGNQLELDNGFNNKAAKIQNAEGSGTSDLRFFTGSTPAENFRITASGNAWLPNDNGKLMCGAGTDLQIYHDGSQSRIVDAGTGSLCLQGSAINVYNAGSTETMAVFTENGSVELYYDNVKKFETLSNGGKLTGRWGIGTSEIAKNDHSLLNIHKGDSGSCYQYFTNTTTGETGGDGFTIGLDGDEKALIWNRENTEMRIGTNGTERITIAAAGDVTVQSGDVIFGTAGKGVVLGATSNVDANTIDDYEEGTFVSHLLASDLTLTSNTYTCYYTKIGRVVVINGYAQGTTPADISAYAANSSHSLSVGNLPFNIINAVGARGAAIVGVSAGISISSNHYVATHGTSNSNSFSIWQEPNTDGTRIGPVLTASTGMALHFQFTYQTT